MNIKFIHVGCHKCGSTFLQEEVWPRIKGLTPFIYGQNYSICDEMEYLVRCGELYYFLDKIKKSVHDKISQYKDVCLSSESFCGIDYAVLGTGHQVKYIPKRLLDIFGKTKILIVIRNQMKILPSFYLDFVRYGYLLNFKEWIDWLFQTYSYNYFKYSYVINCYIKSFGRENVKVVLFEELFNRDTIRDILEEFMIDPNNLNDVDFNKKRNEAYSLPSLVIAKIINRRFGSKLVYGAGPGPSPVKIYNFFRFRCAPLIDSISKKLRVPSPKYYFEGYHEILYELFSEDNKRVSEIISKDLKGYGYI